MTGTDGLRVTLNSASFGDPEKEARLLLALARAPGDSLAGAYANGRLHAEGPALIAGLVARLDELREQPAAASAATAHHLSADDLDALPVGARITTTSGAYAVKIAAGRWATDMAAPLTATAASQDVASDGVTAMRIPLRPPAPMPWHTE